MRKSVFIATLIMTGSLATSAQSGVLVNGAWTPTTCGAKPVAPVLDAHDTDSYNKSIVAVNAYRPKLRAYLDCLVAEGNKDIPLIVSAVKAEQEAGFAADEKIVAEVKAANAKLDKK